MTQNSTIIKLTPKQFQQALSHGLGRAYLHLKEHGDNGIEYILKNACIGELAYDRQCEGSRSAWLYEILKLTTDPAVYENHIQNHLSEISGGWDVDHALGLLYLFAKDGSESSRKALYDWYPNSTYNESWIGGGQIIDLDGIEGFLFVAQEIGKRLISNEERWKGFWECESLFLSATEDLDTKILLERLQQQSKTSPEITAYLENLVPQYKQHLERVEKRATNKTSSNRQRISLPKIKLDIENLTVNYPSKYMGYGKKAPEEELLTLLGDFENETRTEQMTRYLWVFRRRALPILSEKILSLTDHENEELRSATISALGQVSDPRIEQLVIQRLLNLEQYSPAETLTLWTSTAKSTDAPQIVQLVNLLIQEKDTDDLHSILMDLLNFSEETKFTPHLAIAYTQAYQHTPCSLCREDFYNRLKKSNTLPEQIQHEYQYDVQHFPS